MTLPIAGVLYDRGRFPIHRKELEFSVPVIFLVGKMGKRCLVNIVEPTGKEKSVRLTIYENNKMEFEKDFKMPIGMRSGTVIRKEVPCESWNI